MILAAVAEVGDMPRPETIELLEAAGKILRRGMPSKPTGAVRPARRVQTVATFVRSPEVVAWVLQESRDRCEACDSPAPFFLPSGLPYLEVHHVLRLADGGPDVVENAVALCPNCHRRLHHSSDARTYRSTVIALIGRLIDYEAAEDDSLAEGAPIGTDNR